MNNERFSPEQEAMLAAPLDASTIKQRPGGGGRQLLYISGDTAIDAANRIFGFGQWGYTILSRTHEVIEDEKKGRIDFYTSDIELSVHGALYPFPGDGVGVVNAPYTVEMHEKARKEATTDALKRALRHYGDQFGLSLYDKDDYVDDNGTMVQVGEFRPNASRQAHSPKRMVDANVAPKRIEAAKQEKPLDTKTRLNVLYDLAIAKRQIAKGAKAQDFVDLCVRILKINIANVEQLTPSRLDTIEQWLKSINVEQQQQAS